MYVIYPADELLRIYENQVRDPSPVLTSDRRLSCQVTVIPVDGNNELPVAELKPKGRKEKRRERGQTRKRRTGRNEARSHEVAKGNRRDKHTRTMQNSRAIAEDALNPLKDLVQPGLNEPLKQHNASALKLVQTGESYTVFQLFLYLNSHDI